MKVQLWKQLLLTGSLLLAVALSHRRDVAHRRGFTLQALEDMRARSLYGRDTPADEKRYYTNDTKREYQQHSWQFPCRRHILTMLWIRILRRVAARHPKELHDRDVQWHHPGERV